jgi:polyhydroxyalkanoate synthesis regulator phasin
MCGPVQERPATPMESEWKKLRTAIAELGESIEILARRLDPLRRQGPEIAKPMVDRMPPAGSSQIVTDMHLVSGEIDEIRRRVENLTEEVEA